MDRVDKYKRIKDNQQQEKGIGKVVPQERRDFRSNRYNNNRPRRDYAEQPRSNNNQVFGAVFREPVHQILEKVKNESFFKWPNKMVGNPENRNRNLYYQYHRDHSLQQRIAGVYGITWTNFPEKENWSSCCTILAGSVDRPLLGLKEKFLQDISTLFSQYLAEQDHARLE